VLVTVQEVCDGGDNDCDGLIDERSDGQPVIGQVQNNLRAGNATVLAAASGTPEVLAWSESGGAFVGRLDSEDGAGGGTLSAAAPVHVTHASATAFAETLTSLTTDNCYRGDAGSPGQSCAGGDIALATDGEHVVYAEVARSGCAGGQLRLSVSTTASPATLLATGPERRSNVFRGVRPHPLAPFCSVNSTPACASAVVGSPPAPGPFVQEACGLGHPAVALSHGVGLLTYVSAPAGRAACGDGVAVDVEALGVYVRPKPPAAQISPRVEVTDEGAPSTLGQTLAGTPPAVAALASEGFLVAFPDASGDIAIYFVPAPPTPPANVGTYASGDITTRDGVETAPLGSVVLVGTVPGDAGANSVALAVETTTSDATHVRVGLTWRSDCGPTSQLRFRSADVTLSAAGVPTSMTAGPAVQLTNAGLFAAPRVRFVAQGFLTEDAVRDGGMVGAAGGGWYVTWVGEDATMPRQTANPNDEPGALYLERVAVYDGQLVESGGPSQLTTQGVADHQLVVTEPPAGESGLARVTVRAASATGILGIPLTCR
jgi:hypothetical protein